MWITLTGFMGSGKSSVARHLGTELGLPVVDLDACIAAQAGLSIAEIFAEQGEAAFRRLELEQLRRLDVDEDLILDPGGGLVETLEAAEVLRRRGPVFWLDVRWDQVRSRLRGLEADRRPLVARLGWPGVEELYRRRLVRYARSADFRLGSVEAGPEDTARQVRLKLNAWQALRTAEGGVR